MRVGQKNKLTYRWARKGSRPRATHDQRTQSTYLFGAVCPERGAGAALVLPACNSEAMQLHLDEIATKVTPGAQLLLRLEHAHRSALEDHVRRAPRLGDRRLFNVRISISLSIKSPLLLGELPTGQFL